MKYIHLVIYCFFLSSVFLGSAIPLLEYQFMREK